MHDSIEINRNKKFYRAWEMLPGALTWATFLAIIIFSVISPGWIIIFMIIYALYWLARSIIMSGHLIIGYRQYKRNIQKNWLELNKENPLAQKIYHLVIMATYKEDIATLRASIQALVNSDFNLSQVIFVLATEERDKEEVLSVSKILEKEFGEYFYRFQTIMHPQNIHGEVKGKGSNIHYAGVEVLKTIDRMNIPYKNIIVTSLDADNRVHPKYLSCLAYYYTNDIDPVHKSFQPIPMYFNNIWDVPIPIRSISVGSSFWQMIESTRPSRLRNFSSHAQSLVALVKTNFWSSKTIVEDGHQFWRSYLAFNGKHKVVPIFIPIYQDAVLSPKGYFQTFTEQYLQKRRWAWGCSDIPFVATSILNNKMIPFWDRLVHFFRLVEGHFSWATTSIILALAGWIPRFINPTFRDTVLAYNFPIIYSRLLAVALLGLVITLTISTLMLPPKPKKGLSWSIIFEWIITPVMLPVSNVIFSSFSAIDAQTRLMFGKYLGFRVTEKRAASNILKKQGTDSK